MNTQDTRTAVEDAIKKAVPEIIVSRARFEKDGPLYDIDERPITLEDVLRAIKGKDTEIEKRCEEAGVPGVKGNCFGQFLMCWRAKDSQIDAEPMWHLGKPLSEQSDEVIGFLYSVLCNDKEV